MGNYISCTLSNPLPKTSSRPTKVILPTGKILHIQQPTKAAELMMEAPNFFIVNTNCLKIGQRFCPLSADDDLEKGKVYAMFPMVRKNSVVSAPDMGALFLTANSFQNRASKGNIRVLPEGVSQDMAGDTVDVVPRLSLKGTEDVSTIEFRQRMSMSRSKKPLLETIEEEAAYFPK